MTVPLRVEEEPSTLKTMRAARYVAPTQVMPEQVAMPEIGNEEALIAVEACGFCGSDMNITAGTHPRANAPITPEHELCGRAVEIKSLHNMISARDLVTAFPLLSFGLCYGCLNGKSHACEDLRLNGFDVDGGMAQFVKLPVSALDKLPDEMPTLKGASIEPSAVAVNGIGPAHLDHARIAAVRN
jgi:threonine dehydrogenase-like Zn-dependent dehydrogenase